MRVTILGHAGLFVESEATTILVDPWLFGSCYWRSWWHYPPSPSPADEWLSPSYLYLSHHHFDHFHYPSLRRIDKSSHVLIPYFGNDVMPEELARLGFSTITEIRHGTPLELAPGLEVTSFQYGFDDSALVVADHDAVVFDLNDCKIRPADLERLRRRFGSPDLMAKSHSWAQGYPNCYSADNPTDLTLLSRSDYIADFVASVRTLRPRYALPFASMVCFLHPDSWPRNADVITPPEIADALAESPVPGTEVLVLGPGDTWEHRSDGPGAGPATTSVIRRADVADYYAARHERLEALRVQASPAIDRSLAEEATEVPDVATVTDYLDRFLHALPLGIGVVLRRPVLLRIIGERACWVLDWRTRRAERVEAPPVTFASCVELPAAVLARAIRDRILHFVHISMRFRTHVREGGISIDFAFWSLLAMWELGYLPLRRLVNRRFVSVAWRRRAELLALAGAALGQRGPLAARMASRFIASEERPARRS